ncbi:MAG: hypothetical protein R3E39_08185 [Anaerolineae bacterium]
MNEMLPPSLNNIDKISPEYRKQDIEVFWERLGGYPLGFGLPGMKRGFWRPPEYMMERFALPELTFGSMAVQSPPDEQSAEAYRNHYRTRLQMLREHGCNYVSPLTARDIHIAYPKGVNHKAVERFADALVSDLSDFTKKPIAATPPIEYSSIEDAISKLHAQSAQMVVFIMNNERTAYHDIAYKQKWRVKHITQKVFCDKYQNESRWGRKKGFVTMNALDVLQLMDAVPYSTQQFGQYQAQLVIDVGHNRRQFALSLSLISSKGVQPLREKTRVYEKGDHQHDTINPSILKDCIVELIESVMGRRVPPIESLLILRDGEFRELQNGRYKEVKGVNDAMDVLQKRQLIAANATIHLVDYRKSTNKTVRLWELTEDGNVENPLEGIAVYLNSKKSVLTTTGISTLRQGTAQPVTLTRNGQCPDIRLPTQSVFEGAQFNWSSPQVAQSHTLGIKC